MFVGVWLILIGSDQVKPPSVDIEKAMSSWVKPLKRPSDQTTYRLPLFGSTVAEVSVSPARTAAPVSGSLTGSCSMAGPVMTLDQVTPWSVERTTATRFWAACGGWLFEPPRAGKTSITVPSGSTTISLPNADTFCLKLVRFRGVDQVAPPSVVREKSASSRKPELWNALKFCSSLGWSMRSQTT